MKNLLIFTLIILPFAVSCSSAEETTDLSSEAKVFEEFSLRQIDVDFAEVSFKIPAEFERTTIEELIGRLENSDLDLYEKNNRINSYTQLNSYPYRMHLYADTTLTNTITILESEYTYISRRIASDFMAEMEYGFKEQLQNQYDDIVKTDSKYFHSKSKDIVKIAYKITEDGQDYFMTYYVISTKSESLLMIILNKEPIDLDPQIKQLKVK